MRLDPLRTASRLAAASACALGIAAFAASAYAGTATSNMAVSATVVASCTITANALTFGNYDPIVVNATTALDATTTIDTTCTAGSTPAISLDLGANAEGTTRRMTDGAGTPSFLTYELYSESTHTTVWNETNTVSPTADGTQQSSTVFGEIAEGQNTVPVGDYTDTVVATVTF